MNAGGHGRETVDVLVSAEVLPVAPRRAARRPVPVGALGLGYRTSNLGPGDIVLGAEFVVTDAPAARVRSGDRRDRALAQGAPAGRRRTEGRCSGTRPATRPGRLIDELGLKGLHVGGAFVSPKHANFFQAEAGATADDVYRLILDVRVAGPRRDRDRARARSPPRRVRRDRCGRGTPMSAPAARSGTQPASRSGTQPARPGRRVPARRSGPPRRPVDPRVRDRWVAARREEGRRRLRILVAVVSVITAARARVGQRRCHRCWRSSRST